MHYRRESGFSLVEILVVITIIGILLALVVTYTPRAREQSNFTRAQTELSTLGQAAKLYVQKYDTYPPDGSEAGIPAEIREFIADQNYSENWPDGPWTGSLYDWDAWDVYPDDGIVDTYQVSLRFCTYAEWLAPGGPALCQSRAPKQPWAASFNSNNNAVYFCVKGYCRANGEYTNTTYPSYCVNCPNNQGIKYPGEV